MEWLQAEAFARVREPLARRYRNANTKPDRHATFLRKYVLMDRCFTPEEVLAGVEALTPADVQGGGLHSNIWVLSLAPCFQMRPQLPCVCWQGVMAAAAAIVPRLLQQRAGACPRCEPAEGLHNVMRTRHAGLLANMSAQDILHHVATMLCCILQLLLLPDAPADLPAITAPCRAPC